MKLFEDVSKQYIDNNGKSRMLIYERDGRPFLCLMTSPIPPLDIQEAGLSSIYECPIKEALKFIKERGLEITHQDGNPTDGIQGLWVKTPESNSGIYSGYIPIKVAPFLKNVEFSEPTKNDPLRTDAEGLSELEKYKKSRRIAQFLKEYTLFLYATDPEKFGPKSFIVVPDHKYNLEKLNKRLYIKDNDVMLKNGKLIVPSEEVRNKLMDYLKIEIANDEPGVLSLPSRGTIRNYYQSISDFRPVDNQLIFTSVTGIRRWIEEKLNAKNIGTVSQILLPQTKEPYFYRNPNIKRGQLVIIQNVSDGDISRAKTASLRWLKDKVNIGFDVQPKKNIDQHTYSIYSESGQTKKITKTKNKYESIPVFLYGNGTFAALLFLI